MSLFVKDPDSRVDYRVDWGADYPAPNAVVASSWAVAPVEDGGLAVAAHGHDGHSTVATLTGGNEGATYALTNRVTLSSGEIDERSVVVRAEQR